MTVSPVDQNFQDLLLQPLTSDDDRAQPSIRAQVIVTEIQGQQLAFPSLWVDEVLFFPRHKILQLPFYHKPVLGVIPHQGRLVLLMELPDDTPDRRQSVGQQDYIRAIQFSSQIGDLAGTAIKIDKIIGTVHQADLEAQTTLQIFEPEKISLGSFRPYRWA